MKNYKILIYALSIIILAGIIVVCLKGFEVDLMLKKHDSIEFVVQNKYEIEEVKEITSKVIENRKFVIKPIEIFNDGFSINAENITEEEKLNLEQKVKDKYGIDEERVTEIITVPAIKLRDIFKPYFIPGIITAIIICVYYVVYFYKKLKKDSLKVLFKAIGVVAFVDFSFASIIAIARIPVNTIFPPLLIALSIITIIVYYKKMVK